jgi:signal transduction histidine kinase/CheY-like chemotaxis protein/HPt (histidine-containing phosphotransfer) domain-containing protein
MKWNLNKNISIGFLSAITVLILVGIISYYNLNRFRSVMDEEIQTRNFITTLENINSDLKELESGLYGYIITEDSFYLNSYYKASHALDNQAQKLKSKESDPKIKNLQLSLQAQLLYGQNVIELKLNQGLRPAINYIQTGKSKLAINHTQELLNQIKAEKIRSKNLKADIAKINSGNAILFIIIGNLMALTFLIGAVLLLNRDIGKLIETEEELYKAIEIAKKAKNKEEQFLANMSHEIRTPMNAIIGMTNLILNTQLEPKQSSYLKAIRQSSDNLMVIINEILDYSKINAGKIQFESVQFDLSDIVYGLYNTFKIKADEKKIKIIPIIDERLPDAIVGDSGKLNQVLINLIGNAIKFTGPGGSIKLICKLLERKGDDLQIEFSVEDSGIGIPEDKLNTIFEDFAQAASDTARKFGGTGLGLSISKKIIELQGGQIYVTSELGIGSIFSFVLWLKEGKEKVQKKEVPTKTRAQELHGIKILLVEDNEFNQVVAVDTLNSLIKNLTIDVAVNGKVAIEKLKAFSEYDVILMDVQMPEMNGYETTQYIRTHPELGYSEIPIIAMTASATKPEIDRCFESGMSGFVSKPFDADILLIKISAQINKSKSEKEISDENHLLKLKKPINSSSSEVIDLTFLRGLTGGNKEQILKYIQLFLDTVPADWDKLKNLAKEQNWPETRTMAHSLKPRVNYMGMKRAGEIIKELEISSGEEKNLEKIPDLILTFENYVFQAFKELEKEKEII